MKRGRLHETLRKVTRRLRENNIDYAVIGAMALFAHGYRRFTEAVDLLTTPEGLEAVHQRLVGRGYVPAFPGSRKQLRDTQTGVQVEFIATARFPRSSLIERDGYNVITLQKLVELKLISGLTAAARLKDLADVQEAIKVLELPRNLAEQLDPSVRDEYYRLWDAVHTPNAYDPSAG